MADTEQVYLKEIGEHKKEAIVVTPSRDKRSNYDDDTADEKREFAGDVLDVLRGSDHITVDVAEDGQHIVLDLDRDVLDFIFPFEIPTSAITHEVGETNTVVVINSDKIDAQHHYQVIFEVEGEGLHYGCDFVVFPENSAQCLISKLVTIGGEELTLYASMEDNGVINITVPAVMHPESEDTKVFVKRVI